VAKKAKGFGRIYSELNRIAAITRPLTAEELQGLDELVKETRAIAKADSSKMYLRLHQRAKLVQTSKTPRPKHASRQKPASRQVEGLHDVLPAGLTASPDLARADREVLGGLPATGRRR
jgi:isocitrate lyase